MAQQFGRFWLHEKIGHGGMAEIFRATVGPDPQTYAFDLAIKRLHPHLRADRQQVDMFLTEADVAKFLHHDNLVQVYESGLVDGWPYIAMEYVWGLDLARLLGMLRRKRLRFPSDLAVYTAMNVLRGLDYVHRARAPGGAPMDLVHRDITPENIFMTFRGEVKFGDFGIARVSFLEPAYETTELRGKVRYMPPEVLRGTPPSQRDDVWSLAATMYEMLMAEPLFADIDEHDLRAGAAVPRVSVAELETSDIDERLARILARALHRNPSKRYQKAAELYRDLKGYLRGEGIQVDASALARFVRAATGVSTQATEPVTRPAGDNFAAPEYQSPAGPSMTQRFELVRRRRRWWVPVLVAGVLVVAVVVAFWVHRAAGAEKRMEFRPLDTGPRSTMLTPTQTPGPQTNGQ